MVKKTLKDLNNELNKIYDDYKIDVNYNISIKKTNIKEFSVKEKNVETDIIKTLQIFINGYYVGSGYYDKEKKLYLTLNYKKHTTNLAKKWKNIFDSLNDDDFIILTHDKFNNIVSLEKQINNITTQ